MIGTLTETAPDQFTTVFQLFDVLRGEQILGYRFMSARADLRATAHRISDMIFEKLVGIPGVFSTQIAYVSEEKRSRRTKRFRLIVSDADGENAHIVADSPQPLLSPSWSPDGRRLAYVSFEGDQQAIFVQTLKTGTRERVSGRKGVNSSPAFSPDGRLLALTLSNDQGNLDIFTLDVGTQVLRQLTTDAAIDTEAAWSPDGRTLYFNSDRSGGPQIYRVGAEPGARAQRVTFEGRLQRAAARVAGRQEGRDGLRREQPVSDRRDRRRERRAADTHERPARRVAELRAERRADHLCDAQQRPRRARVGDDRRPDPARDRIGRGRRARARLGTVPAALSPSARRCSILGMTVCLRID